MRERDPLSRRDRTALPVRATGIVLGLWIAALLLFALVVVPALFGLCTVAGG